MAILHTTPLNAGTEATIKILDDITAEIKLMQGKILMGPFSQAGFDALKLSLFIKESHYEFIGVRNVFIEDVGDSVEVRFGGKDETFMFLEALRDRQSWTLAFPETHRRTYPLEDLVQAATDIRNFMLLGKLPGTEIVPYQVQTLTELLPTKGYIEFNVLATFSELDDFE